MFKDFITIPLMLAYVFFLFLFVCFALFAIPITVTDTALAGRMAPQRSSFKLPMQQVAKTVPTKQQMLVAHSGQMRLNSLNSNLRSHYLLQRDTVCLNM